MKSLRRFLSTVLVAALAIGLSSAPALADEPVPEPDGEGSVAVSATGGTEPGPAPNDPPDPAQTKWPAKGTVTATVPTINAAGYLSVATPGSSLDWPTSVDLSTYDAQLAEKAEIPGVILEVAGTQPSTTVSYVKLTVNYTDFQHVFGGDYGARLGLARLPQCVLTTPEDPACQVLTPVASVNDDLARTVSAVVEIPASTMASSSVLALTAGTGSAAGDYTATSLAPSYSWAAGGQGGDFTMSYPVKVPPSPGGLAPDVTLHYSSGSVDGRVATTNNQPSWIGEGWDLQFGYVEAHYRSCRDDGQTINDLCYDDLIDYTLVFNGRASRLIRDDTSGIWHTEADDGLKLEQRTGLWGTNQVHQGLHWVAFTQDGTQYDFGTDVDSALGVVVFGDDAGEQCHTSTLFGSYCDMGYRWNLRRVADRNGNVIDYQWDGLGDQKQQKYGRHNNAAAHLYDREAVLQAIEYGANTVAGTGHTARVEFTVGWRCIEEPCMGGTSNNYKWYDTPWDLYCRYTATSCPNLFTPAFYSWYRLASITTQVRNSANTAWVPVDRWNLQPRFPGTGDGTPMTLWLQGITHQGLVGGTAAAGESVSFENVKLANRVYLPGSEVPMYKHRIGAIYTSAGGYTRVNYAPAECTPGTLPPEDNNTKRCFPVYWNNGAKAWNWFHKYVVGSVVEKGQSTADADETWTYLYANSSNLTNSQVMWAWDDAPNTPDSRKSWTQWRGYLNVETIHGPVSGPARTSTRRVFHRGLNGDRATRSGGTRSVTMADGGGGTVADERWLRGFVRVETAMNTVDGTPVAATRHVPVSALSAYRAYGFGKAYFVREGSTITTVLKRDGTWRTSQTDTTYDILLPGEDLQYGLPLSTKDHGDLAVSGDEVCTYTMYAQYVPAWLLNFPSQVITDDCATTPATLAGTRMYYDGSTILGGMSAISRGLATRTDTMSGAIGAANSWSTTSTTTYDKHGRVTESRDGLNHLTRTEYVPVAGGPVTATKVTNPALHVTTTEVDPTRGLPAKVTDANNKVTTVRYDPLGRLTAVWLPGRATTATPNAEYAYQLRNPGGNVVTTKALGPNDNQVVSYQIYDGRLRLRQTQVPTTGGRAVVDTVYNDRGLVVEESRFFNAAAPDTTLLAFDHAGVAAQQRYLYDHLARRTADILISAGVEQWRTSRSYWGDQTFVDEPTGGTDRTDYFDPHDRLLRRSQVGTVDTRFEPDRLGRLVGVTDDAGNRWTYVFDRRGQTTEAVDPDAGRITFTYDNAGRMSTSANANGTILAYAYDSLGRKTAVHNTSTASWKYKEWTYDTQAKGQLTSSTRWHGGQAYKVAVTGYDNSYRPQGTSVTIPGTETGLAGTYTFGATYNVDGSLATELLPELGDLAAETVTHTYSDIGQPNGLGGLASYVASTSYSYDGKMAQLLLGAAGKRVRQTFSYGGASRRLSTIQLDTENQITAGTYDNRYTTEFGYTNAGDVSVIAGKTAGVRDQVECFRYDALRRLTVAWTEATWSCATPQRTGADPYWHDYTYEDIGSRKTMTVHGATSDVTTAYQYPAAGQPRPHALTGTTGGTVASYTYDAVGNTRTRPGASGTQTLDWYDDGGLAKVTENGQVKAEYVYDADGNRLVARDAAGRTLYLPAGNELRHTSSAAGTRYYSHAGLTVAIRTTGGLTWLAADHHGTNTTAINPTTLSAQRRRGLPFGGPRGTQPAGWPGDRGFVGGTTDPTGLTHLGAREYDPSIGRFLSVDSVMNLSDPQQMHGYAYANNNPTTLSDPSGLEPGSWCNTSECGAQNAQTQTSHPMMVNGSGGSASTGGGSGGGGSGGGGSGKPKQKKTVSAPNPPGQAGPPASKPEANCHNRQAPPCYELYEGWIGDQAGTACRINRPMTAAMCVPGGAWSSVLAPRGYIPPTPPRPPVPQTTVGCRVPTITSAPGTAPEIRSQVDRFGKPVPGPGSEGVTGVCIGGGAQLGGALGGDICFVHDQKGFAIVASKSVGAGPGAGANVTTGVMVSNADHAEDLAGGDLYAAGGFKVGPVAAEVSGSTNLNGVYSGKVAWAPGIGGGVHAGRTDACVFRPLDWSMKCR